MTLTFRNKKLRRLAEERAQSAALRGYQRSLASVAAASGLSVLKAVSHLHFRQGRKGFEIAAVDRGVVVGAIRLRLVLGGCEVTGWQEYPS